MPWTSLIAFYLKPHVFPVSISVSCLLTRCRTHTKSTFPSEIIQRKSIHRYNNKHQSNIVEHVDFLHHTFMWILWTDFLPFDSFVTRAWQVSHWTNRGLMSQQQKVYSNRNNCSEDTSKTWTTPRGTKHHLCDTDTLSQLHTSNACQERLALKLCKHLSWNVWSFYTVYVHMISYYAYLSSS